MVFGLNAGLSGMRLNADRIRVTANNIANMNTPGFQAGAPGVSAEPASNENALETRAGDSGASTPDLPEPSNVDLAKEMANLIIAKHGYTANIKTVKTADELLGTLLNIKT